MKPLVFLSHSARDQQSINRLKGLLELTTHETIKFFCSSDGDSIPAGTLWMDSILRAVSEASIMFVFLSPNSLQSQWIFFEAGLAHCREKQVIPVGIDGVKIASVPAPLGLFNGFDLNVPEGLDRLIAILNKAFSYTHKIHSPIEAFAEFVGRTATPLKDGEYDFRVLSRSAGGERAHEQIRVKIQQQRMSVWSGEWESVGTLTKNRFVGRFKFDPTLSADGVGTHDFEWNGREFIGSARLDSGAWTTDNLIWRPMVS